MSTRETRFAGRIEAPISIDFSSTPRLGWPGSVYEVRVRRRGVNEKSSVRFGPLACSKAFDKTRNRGILLLL